jgi:hypothetical protein
MNFRKLSNSTRKVKHGIETEQGNGYIPLSGYQDSMKRYLQIITLFLSLTVGVTMGGCFTTSDVVTQRPPNTWTLRDCQTVLVSAMTHNLNDNRTNVKVIVTPYLPRVIKAMTRMDQIRDSSGVDSTKYDEKYDALLHASTGLLYDWDQGLKYSVKHQRYYQNVTDYDSLLFLIAFINQGYPCIPLVKIDQKTGTHPLTLPGDWPCYTPELNHLNDEILLINDRGETLTPRYVWGVENNQLTTDEHIFVMFSFTGGSKKHFLQDSEDITIVFKTFTPTIEYKYEATSLVD